MAHFSDTTTPQPTGGYTPGIGELKTPGDFEISIGRRRLPTPPTTAPRAPTPRMSIDELKAFKERIAGTRLGQSISYTARSRGALGMIHSRPNANPMQGIGLVNSITTPARSEARAGGGEFVTDLCSNILSMYNHRSSS
jgi:hypothetical protein